MTKRIFLFLLCVANRSENCTFCPHSVFMCFVWIWEQTAIISLYSINWLVFITEKECVYCAVQTGSLYTPGLTFSNSTFCPHSVFMCFVWIWEQTAIISLYSINWLVFITERECVYWAVRTESLYTTHVKFLHLRRRPVRFGAGHFRLTVDKVALGQLFLRVFQFPLSVSFHQCSILIHSSTTDAVYCFLSQYFSFPCHYHSTNTPYSYLCTFCSYKKEKWAKPGTLTRTMLFRK